MAGAVVGGGGYSNGGRGEGGRMAVLLPTGHSSSSIDRMALSCVVSYQESQLQPQLLQLALA